MQNAVTNLLMLRFFITKFNFSVHQINSKEYNNNSNKLNKVDGFSIKNSPNYCKNRNNIGNRSGKQGACFVNEAVIYKKRNNGTKRRKCKYCKQAL